MNPKFNYVDACALAVAIHHAKFSPTNEQLDALGHVHREDVLRLRSLLDELYKPELFGHIMRKPTSPAGYVLLALLVSRIEGAVPLERQRRALLLCARPEALQPRSWSDSVLF